MIRPATDQDTLESLPAVDGSHAIAVNGVKVRVRWSPDGAQEFSTSFGVSLEGVIVAGLITMIEKETGITFPVDRILPFIKAAV